MNKRISLKAHLSGEQIETRYRKAKDAVERSHWQIIWLLAQGKTAQQIAEVTGYSYDWIGCIVHRYNQGGPSALGDRRHDNPGGSFILSAEQQAQLQRALDEPPADDGLWSGRHPWPAGSVSKLDARCTRNAAGSTSSGWAEAFGSCVLATPKPTPRLKAGL